MRRQPEREGRLSHRRASTDDDQVGRLQAREKVVELAVAGGHTRDRLAPVVEVVESFKALGQKVLQ